jgi:hypothetical protein
LAIARPIPLDPPVIRTCFPPRVFRHGEGFQTRVNPRKIRRRRRIMVSIVAAIMVSIVAATSIVRKGSGVWRIQ